MQDFAKRLRGLPQPGKLRLYWGRSRQHFKCNENCELAYVCRSSDCSISQLCYDAGNVPSSTWPHVCLVSCTPSCISCNCRLHDLIFLTWQKLNFVPADTSPSTCPLYLVAKHQIVTLYGALSSYSTYHNALYTSDWSLKLVKYNVFQVHFRSIDLILKICVCPIITGSRQQKCFQKLSKWQKQRKATVKYAAAIDKTVFSVGLPSLKGNSQVATIDRFLICRQDATFGGFPRLFWRTCY